MATTSIKDIPQELLLEIVKCLQHFPGDSDSRKTLYNLCLVKPFGPAATELLYEQGPSLFVKSHVFLRTIILKPLLAALVRRLDLDPWMFRFCTTKHDSVKAKILASDIDLFVGSIKA
jgi:hypothetical protein